MRLAQPILMITMMGCAFVAQDVYAHCAGRAPLSDSQVRAGYEFVQNLLRENPTQQFRDWQKVRSEFKTKNEFLAYAHHYVSRPESTYLAAQHAYRLWYNSCSGNGGSYGGGGSSAPIPDCDSNTQCLSDYQCVGGTCKEKGTTAGDCHYSDCADGYHCSTDGICEE